MIKSIAAKLSLLILLIAITTCYYEREIHEELEICFRTFNGLYVMNMDGSNQTPITFSVDDYNPSWSPDGSKILFHSTRESLVAEIFVVNSDGTGLKKVISGGSDPVTCPTWSSDGKKIIFIGEIGGVLNYIFIADTEGNIIKTFQPLNPSLSLNSVSLSPDENYLYFTDALSSSELYSINLTSNTTPYSYGILNYSSISFSPDGKFLLCYNPNTPEINIYNINTNTITFFDIGSDPCWTPDGKTIIYVNGGLIYRKNIDGTNQKPLTTRNDCSSPCVKWKPK